MLVARVGRIGKQSISRLPVLLGRGVLFVRRCHTTQFLVLLTTTVASNTFNGGVWVSPAFLVCVMGVLIKNRRRRGRVGVERGSTTERVD
jgi:hypothetical protein